ncbi:hypothetical protein G6F57_020894 [Rhizopus arrhizus]|nr:hypothetical protein G6F57_020894 [Rhizopus arrhizus]
MRATMAPSCTATITPVSVPIPTWLKSCRNTVANVTTANCGLHMTPIATAARQTRPSRSGEAAGRAGAVERVEGGPSRPGSPRVRRQPRQQERAQAAAQRHRGVADAHRQAALAFVEPGHHGPPAGAVDATAQAADQHQPQRQQHPGQQNGDVHQLCRGDLAQRRLPWAVHHGAGKGRNIG